MEEWDDKTILLMTPKLAKEHGEIKLIQTRIHSFADLKMVRCKVWSVAAELTSIFFMIINHACHITP